jgi:predicted ABC-type transport system involved in lysophospholipase L1 biosynthesis ATPase subunit
VFQFYHLLPELDVLENVMLPAMNSSLGLLGGSPVQPRQTMTRSSPRERALNLLQSVGLIERAEHLPAELSGGEHQRVAVARALVNEPELLLADEPTGNLDSVTGAQVLNVLFGLVRDKRRTLLLVTHNAEIAARCDRILKLQDGSLNVA